MERSGHFQTDAKSMVHRVKCGLAEMGYHNRVYADGTTTFGRPRLILNHSSIVPDAVWWQALHLVYPEFPCWSCWYPNSDDQDRAMDCAAGNCVARPDDPRKPPLRDLVSA